MQIFINYRKILPVFFLLIFYVVLTYGQNNPYNDVSIASPVAASLGKYIDYPVSYHTGVPDISIPIYTVQCGPLQLPISLNYHASGLRVMEPASWVGAGWSLAAGGIISRTVRGAPDERNTSNVYNQSKGHYSDTGYTRYYYYGTQPDWQSFAAGRSDGEPDLYYFNFAGYSGKFYFSDAQKPVLIPDDKDMKIAPYYSGSGSIQGFKVTTADGTCYSFGSFFGGFNADTTNPFTVNGLSTGTAISTWYLTQIASGDNQSSITLSYAAERYSYYTISSTPIYSSDQPTPPAVNLVKNYINGVRLSHIVTPNGQIDFLPGAVRTDLGANQPKNIADYVNTESVALGAIQISNGGSFCKKFNL